MSSTKRRLKRKLALLVKIDRAVSARIVRGNGEEAHRLWATSAQALGRALWRKGLEPQVSAALNADRARRGHA